MKTIILTVFFIIFNLITNVNINVNGISDSINNSNGYFTIPYKKFSNEITGEYDRIKINCNEYNCKNEFGICSDDKQYCICKSGFIHSPKVTSKKRLCGYKKYNGIVAIILELFLPGLGIFYLNSYTLGFIKTVLFTGTYYSWDKYKGFKKFVISIVGYTLIVYHFKDLILLFGKYIQDRNGIFPY